MIKNTATLLFLISISSTHAVAFETYEPSSGTLTIQDLRLNGTSYNVTLTLGNQLNSAGQYQLAVTALTPNNNCSHSIYKGINGWTYNINTYTSNGIQSGGIVQHEQGQGRFTAAWSSAPLSSNPFFNTSGLSSGAYGIVGVVHPYYTGFTNGDRIRVVGSPDNGFSITSLTSNSSIFFPPATSQIARPFTCPFTSGTYTSLDGESYSVVNLGSGAGGINAMDDQQYSFSASWIGNYGSMGVVHPYFSLFKPGQKLGMIDIGANGIAIFPVDANTNTNASTVAVFIQ